MVETEFVVRCSGRVSYAKGIAIGAIFTYAVMRLHSYSPVQVPLTLVYAAIWGIIALFVIVAFIRAKIQYIDVDSEGVTMHTGLINKKTTYVPYSKIDNVRINRNLVDRIFFLGSLGIDTAGSAKVEIEMNNVASHYLDRMQRHIQRKMEEAHVAHPEQPKPRRF